MLDTNVKLTEIVHRSTPGIAIVVCGDHNRTVILDLTYYSS